MTDQIPSPTSPAAKGRSMTWLLYVGIALIVIAGASMAVLSMLGEKAIESGTGVNMERDGSTMTYEKDGNSVTVNMGAQGAVKLPNDFPGDFPLMSGMTPVSATSAMEADGKRGYLVMWTTDASVQDVEKHFKDSLTKQGWQTSFSNQTPDSLNLVFQRGTTMSGDPKEAAYMQVYTDGSGKTGVSLTLAIIE